MTGRTPRGDREERETDRPGAGEPPAARGAEPRAEAWEEPLLGDEQEALEEEPAHSPAATALWVLVGVLVVAAGTLWLAPRVAPYVPAPVARLLAPVPERIEEEVATLRARLAEREETLGAEIGALEARLAELAERAGRPGLPQAAAERLGALERRVERLVSEAERRDATAEAARAQGRAALAEAEAARAEAGDAAEAAAGAEERAADAAETAQTAAERLDRLAERVAQAERTAVSGQRQAEEATAAAGSAERRAAGLEDRLAALEGEVRALSQTLAETPARPADRPAGRELNAAVQALQARLDSVEAAVRDEPDYLTREDATELARRNALEEIAERTAEQIYGLGRRLDAVRARLAEDLERIEAGLSSDISETSERLSSELGELETRIDDAERMARGGRREALDEAEAALRNAALRGARDALETRVQAGEPYAVVLAEIESLTGQSAPAELAQHASSGIAARADLLERLPAAANDALEAEARARAREGSPGERMASWLRSQIVARPTSETEGENLPARLSRVEARLEDRDAAAALEEARALPDAARAAMTGWIADLETRVSAQEALAAFLAPTMMSE
jgi:hypothetical protein